MKSNAISVLIVLSLGIVLYFAFIFHECNTPKCFSIGIGGHYYGGSSSFDEEKWSMTKALNSVGTGNNSEYQLHQIELVEMIHNRQDMILDLIQNRCDIISRRENALKVLGKPLDIVTFRNDGYNKFWSEARDPIFDVDTDIFVRSRDSIIRPTGDLLSGGYLGYTKSDLVYIAGSSGSGHCLLVLLYDKHGILIKCGWFEGL